MDQPALPRLLVIGGGPIGIEFSLAMVKTNQYEVILIEKGQPSENVTQWGFVRLFSPNSLNTTELGLKVLDELSVPHPDEGVFPTGHEFNESYLSHVWGYLQNIVEIHTHTRVVSIGRGSCLKGDMKARGGQAFRVLVEDIEGVERIITADVVVDASGSYGNRNWLGQGGIPALGERKLSSEIVVGVPNVTENESKYLNKCSLVVGSGYSAITTINNIKLVSEKGSSTKVVWVTRQGGEVYSRVQDDPLPERDALSIFGNSLTSANEEGGFQVDRRSNTCVMSLSKTNTGQYEVILQSSEGGESKVLVDNVVANVGYRPDTTIYQELQVHQCYATEGPMKLAAAMMASQGMGGDCLQQVAPGPQTLISPEPNFFIIGIKSYGRGSAFLLKIGHAQIDMVKELLTDQK